MVFGRYEDSLFHAIFMVTGRKFTSQEYWMALERLPPFPDFAPFWDKCVELVFTAIIWIVLFLLFPPIRHNSILVSILSIFNCIDVWLCCVSAIKEGWPKRKQMELTGAFNNFTVSQVVVLFVILRNQNLEENCMFSY